MKEWEVIHDKGRPRRAILFSLMENIRSRLRSLLGTFFTKKSPGVVGIDIGASAIKVVQLRRRRGQAVLETYGELALGPYANSEIGRAVRLPAPKLKEALQDLLREAKVTSKRAGIALPLSSSLVTLIEMPALEGAELNSMVPIEARKYIPVPISEVFIDWWVIPREATTPAGEAKIEVLSSEAPSGTEGALVTGKIDVLVVVIHNEALKEYRDLVDTLSLNSSFFEVELFSTVRSVVDESQTPVIILDMGAATTKLAVVDRGIVRNVHTVNRGSQEITLGIARSLNIPVSQAESLKRSAGLNVAHNGVDVGSTIVATSLNYLFSEATRFLHAYEQRFKRSVETLILSGGGVNLKGFVELAKSHFPLHVRLADPFEKVEAPAFLHGVLKEAGPEFAVAIGAALRCLDEVE